MNLQLSDNILACFASFQDIANRMVQNIDTVCKAETEPSCLVDHDTWSSLYASCDR